VWSYYRENYRPQDLVVTASGGLDHDELIGLVEASLTKAGMNLSEAAKPVARREISEAEIVRGSALKIVNRPIAQANVLIGMRV
jgi:predicted Zn-dependent peptidase